jgi:hypothetical protein
MKDKLLGREAIHAAFRALDEALDPADEEPHRLVIVGGAAMVVLYDARPATEDVDAVIVDRETLQASRKIANALRLPEDWLNDGAKGFMHGIKIGESLYEGPNLCVAALAPEQMLAMKLGAWRDDIDIEDARLLLSKIPGEQSTVWQSLEPYIVPGRHLKAQYAFEDLVGVSDSDA